MGWRPPPGWAPDPQWPPAPPGWQFWEADTDEVQSMHPSGAYDAAPAQPIGSWAARPRQNQGLGDGVAGAWSVGAAW